MKNKRIVAITAATVISANMLPLNVVNANEQEVENKEIQIQNEEQSVYATAVRTLMAKIKLENSHLGTVTNLNNNTPLQPGDNSISLKTHYDNYKEESKWGIKTYRGDIVSSDEEVKISVKSKSGYDSKIEKNNSILSTGKNYITNTDNEITINSINTTEWGAGKTELVADLNGDITVKFAPKENAQKITTEIIGNGNLEAPQELYYNNNEALIDENSTHVFKINPGQNQKATATLNGEEIQISENNTIEIGQGHLVVEFSDADETEKYNLNLKATPNGKVTIDNRAYSGEENISLSKEYEAKLEVKADEGYFIRKVALDNKELPKNNDGSYTIPTTDLDSRDLEIVFAEKINPTIKVEELRVPYTGQEQELVYNVVGEDEEVIHTGKAVFTKRDLLNRPVIYTPKDIGNHSFKATFEGNEKYNSASLEGTLEIYDNRKEVTIEFVNNKKAYNGEVQKPEANVLNEQGQVIGKADVSYDFKPEHILAPAGKGVGTYAVTAKFKGDKDYRYTEAKGDMEIIKCKPRVSIDSKTAKYTGSPIKTGVSINPNCGYINLYTGVNTKLSPTVYVDVNLGDDLIGKLISDLINSMEIKNVADLKKMFENEELIKLLESAGINISDITGALAYLPDNLNLSFGAPVNAGAYVSTVVVLDKNANVAVGIGGLAIDKAKKNVVFTEDSLASDGNIKPGEAYVMEAIVEGTDEKAEIKYTGVTGRGRIYSSNEAPMESGAYVAHASIKGNSNYRGDIAARGFTISKSTSDVEITSEVNKKYDGKDYEASAVVKDKKGNVVEGANVKYSYYKGLIKLSGAPKKVGNYKVIATYSGDNAHYGSSTSFKFNITK